MNLKKYFEQYQVLKVSLVKIISAYFKNQAINYFKQNVLILTVFKL